MGRGTRESDKTRRALGQGRKEGRGADKTCHSNIKKETQEHRLTTGYNGERTMRETRGESTPWEREPNLSVRVGCRAHMHKSLLGHKPRPAASQRRPV